jgi:hypothetical protein
MGTSKRLAPWGGVQRFRTATDDAGRGAPECADMSPTTNAPVVVSAS